MITYDKKVLYVGELNVKDKKLLKELRDELLTVTGNKLVGIHKTSVEEELGGFYSVLPEGFLRHGDTLIHQYATDVVGDDCLYTKKEFECRCLNLIRLFNSLLGDIDAKNYKNRVIQEFIKLGIVNVSPFEQNWKLYFKNIVNGVFAEMNVRGIYDMNKLKMMELRIFRMALEEGIISYDINNSMCFANSNGKPFLTSQTTSDLKQMEINNALLLGDDTIFQKQIRRMKK